MTELFSSPRGLFHVNQYCRILRWYGRFKDMNDGRQLHADFDCQEDDMLAFFMNCHHLKDWVIQDFYVKPEHPNNAKFCRLRDEVKKFVNNNDCLKICADICNGAKHLHRDERPHFGEPIRMRTEIHMDEKIENPPVKRIWKITAESGKEWDSFELATECVKKWKEFLDNHATQIKELSNVSSLAQGWDGTDNTYISKLKKGSVIGTKGVNIYCIHRNNEKNK